MSPNIVLTLNLVVLVISAPPPVFVGDISLWQYLRLWCLPSEHLAYQLILFDAISFSNQTIHHAESYPLREYLNLHSCEHSSYQNISADFVMKKLSVSISTRSIFVLFDLTDQVLRPHHLVRLSEIYFRCLVCHYSFIILSRLPASQLYQLAHQANLILPRSNFRATLVSLAGSHVIHIRPVLNGCHQVDTVVLADNQHVFQAMKIAPTKCNLGGITLNVSVNMAPPLCYYKLVNNQVKQHFSIEFEMLKLLEKRYNFKTNLLDAKQDYGRLVQNKYWTGTVGRVFNLTHQIGMCCLSATPARLEAVDYSNPVVYDHVTFLSKEPKLRTRRWILFSPFTWTVWLLILVSLVVLIITIHFFSYTSGHPIPLPTISTQLLGIFFKQHVCGITNFTTICLLYTVWFLATLTLSNSYNGCFHSILALPEMEPAIDTVEYLAQLADEDKIMIITYNDSSHESSLREVTFGIWHQLGQNFKRTGSMMGVTDKDLIPKLENSIPPLVLLSPRIVLLYNVYLYAHQPLHIALENIEADNYGFSYAKRSPLVQPFDKVIKQSFEHGFLQHWTTKAYRQMPNAIRIQTQQQLQSIAMKRQDNIRPLKLIDFYSLLIFWNFGNIFSTLIVIIEIVFLLWHRFRFGP